MASYTQWDSPSDLNLDDATIMTAYLQDFDNKMVSAGLIKVPELSSDFVKPPTWPTSTYGQSTIVAQYTYTLPKGYQKVEYADVSGQSYKTISRASYYKTDTQIQFVFKYLKATSDTSIASSNTQYFSLTSLMYCDLYTRNTSTSNFMYISAMGSYWVSNSSTNFSTTGPLKCVTRTNYIIHTENMLAVYFGCYNIANASSISGDLQTRQCMINFVLRRSKDINGHCILYSTSSRIASTTAPNPLQMTSCVNNALITNVHDYLIRNLFTWNYESGDANQGGEAVIYPVIEVYGGYKAINNGFYVTKSLPADPVATDNNAVINYDGTPVIMGTLFIGYHTRTFMWGLNVFGFMVIKPSHTVITGDLT